MQFSLPIKARNFEVLRTFSAGSSSSRTDRKLIPHQLFILLLGALAFCALSGCALLQSHSDPTRFYVLTSQTKQPICATENEFKQWKVGLRPMKLSAYLRNRSIVIRTGTNQIQFADFDRWAEPLDQGISRVIKEDLSSARNVESVAMNSRGDDTLDYEVAIRVLAFEGMRAEQGKNSIHFAVTWEARAVGTNSTAIKHGGFADDAADWDGKNYGQLAAQLSKAIADASKTLAADLPMEAKNPGKTNAE